MPSPQLTITQLAERLQISYHAASGIIELLRARSLTTRTTQPSKGRPAMLYALPSALLICFESGLVTITEVPT